MADRLLIHIRFVGDTMAADRLEPLQYFGLSLSFANAIACLAIMVQEDTRSDKCYKSDKRWNLGIAFTIFSILLFAVNMKRIVLSKLGKYNCVGLMYMKKDGGPPSLMDHKLRAYGLLLHVGGFITAIWWLADAGGVNCGAGKGTLEAFTWIAFLAFIGNTGIEGLLAFVDPFKVEETQDGNTETSRTEPQHAIAHLLSSTVLGGVCFVIFMRLHEELNNKPIDQGLLVLNLFLSLVAFTMLSGDYIIAVDLKKRSLLQTHKFTYALVLVLCVTSLLTWVRVEAGSGQFDPNTPNGGPPSNKRKKLVDAQFFLSITAMLVGPLLANFTEAITGESTGKDNVALEFNRTELRTQTGGMSYNRLSKRDKLIETSLTFV